VRNYSIHAYINKYSPKLNGVLLRRRGGRGRPTNKGPQARPARREGADRTRGWPGKSLSSVAVVLVLGLALVLVVLRGEYAERRKKYDIIFRFSLKMEYPRAYKWNLIEYPRIFNDIPFMGLPQEYPYSYSPRRLEVLVVLIVLVVFVPVARREGADRASGRPGEQLGLTRYIYIYR